MSREVGPRDISAYLAIRDHAFDLDIDVIHGHGAKGGAYSRLVARALKRGGRRVVSCYTPHGGSLHYHPATVAGRIYMQLERRLARFTDALVFESAYSAGRYAAQVGAPGCAARVIPNGLGPEDFVAPETDPDAADFLFVGELRRLKGVDVLVNALARVREHRPVSAVIVGAGPDAEAFEREARGLWLDDIGGVQGTDAGPRGVSAGSRARHPLAGRELPLHRPRGRRSRTACSGDQCGRHPRDRRRHRHGAAAAGGPARARPGHATTCSTSPRPRKRVRCACSRPSPSASPSRP